MTKDEIKRLPFVVAAYQRYILLKVIVVSVIYLGLHAGLNI